MKDTSQAVYICTVRYIPEFPGFNPFCFHLFCALTSKNTCPAHFYWFMSLLELLSQQDVWESFYNYKCSLAAPKSFIHDLRRFIDSKAYLPVCEIIRSGERFPLPEKSIISKMSAQKKRTVYTYPAAENTVLKLLTWLLLRKYDSSFSDNLFSFRPGRTAKDAISYFTRYPNIQNMFAYKTDVSNYFNEVPVQKLIPILERVLQDDPVLFQFLRDLLQESEVLENGVRIIEEKGIMAGTPLSAFYANVYLKELDWLFFYRNIPYARYSDDMIVFADSREEAENYAFEIRRFIADAGLHLNPEKEEYFTPDTGWIFLGFSYLRGVVDIAPASLIKMKQKMKRKTRALTRWQKRNDLSGEKAARAFIRIFNSKIFYNNSDHDLTWSLWYFPVINTDNSLKVIDHYAQECIRYLLTGKHTKSRFNARYDDIKNLGYKCLVHAFYEYKKENTSKNYKNNA